MSLVLIALGVILGYNIRPFHGYMLRRVQKKSIASGSCLMFMGKPAPKKLAPFYIAAAREIGIAVVSYVSASAAWKAIESWWNRRKNGR